MRYFPIRKLVQFTGIKAHTIRIWEKRYAILQPERNGAVRSYTINDVKQLLNISLLVNNGYRISKIAKLSANEIEDRAGSVTSREAKLDRTISKLIIAMYSGDIDHFEELLGISISTYDIDVTIREVIIPFLARVQLTSYTDTSADAHFVVTAIRKKLIYGIEKIQQPAHTSERTLLFLPEGEHYDLLLLYFTYKLKSEGHKTLYLGTNISPGNLEIVLQQKKPVSIYTYIAANYTSDLKRYVRIVEDLLPASTFIIAEEKDSGRRIKSKIRIIYVDHEKPDPFHELQ